MTSAAVVQAASSSSPSEASFQDPEAASPAVTTLSLGVDEDMDSRVVQAEPVEPPSAWTMPPPPTRRVGGLRAWFRRVGGPSEPGAEEPDDFMGATDRERVLEHGTQLFETYYGACVMESFTFFATVCNLGFFVAAMGCAVLAIRFRRLPCDVPFREYLITQLCLYLAEGFLAAFAIGVADYLDRNEDPRSRRVRERRERRVVRVFFAWNAVKLGVTIWGLVLSGTSQDCRAQNNGLWTIATTFSSFALGLQFCTLLQYLMFQRLFHALKAGRVMTEADAAARGARSRFHMTSSALALQDGSELCPICCVEWRRPKGSSEQIVKTGCERPHYFHADCLASWIAISNTCPVCRQEDFLDRRIP